MQNALASCDEPRIITKTLIKALCFKRRMPHTNIAPSLRLILAQWTAPPVLLQPKQ